MTMEKEKDHQLIRAYIMLNIDVRDPFRFFENEKKIWIFVVVRYRCIADGCNTAHLPTFLDSRLTWSHFRWESKKEKKKRCCTVKTRCEKMKKKESGDFSCMQCMILCIRNEGLQTLWLSLLLFSVFYIFVLMRLNHSLSSTMMVMVREN